MRVPSGEKEGLTFTAPFEVNCFIAPVATSTSQMFGLPEREEKKAIFFPSGDQFVWKSPPRPVVSCRELDSVNEKTQISISPPRSQFQAMFLPSHNHSP